MPLAYVQVWVDTSHSAQQRFPVYQSTVGLEPTDCVRLLATFRTYAEASNYAEHAKAEWSNADQLPV